MIEKLNLAQKFRLVDEYWSPRIAAELNDAYIKFAKLKGEFVWHHHENEDELFLVVQGVLRMQLRDREILVREGELIIIPRGVEHKPVADDTGNVRNERTRTESWI
jgi:mannose-6-phosphate isomerase-like protein (cupin superfamily)